MKHLFNSLVSIFIAVLVIIAAGIVMSTHALGDQIRGHDEIRINEESEGGDEDTEPSAFC